MIPPANVRVIPPTDMGLLGATRISQLAGEYFCVIRIGHAAKWADARDILALSSLGAAAGEPLSIEARGDYALEAAGSVAGMMANGYGLGGARVVTAGGAGRDGVKALVNTP